MSSENLIINALYYLTAAVIAVPLFKKIGLGSILGYLCAGLVIGPHVLGIISDPEEVLHFAEYGVILLLFIIGLELAPDKLMSMRSHIAIIGGSQMLLTGTFIGVIFLLLGMTLQQGLILGLVLSLSSTAFAVQLMRDERIIATPLGRKGFSVLLFQDLAVIPILLLVSFLAPISMQEDQALPWYFGVIAVLAVLVASKYALNPILRLLAQTNVREIMTAGSLLIVVSVAVLMEEVGLSMGLGAFLAGIVLANSDYRHQLESDIEPFKGILLGLFFIAVGMTLDLGLLLSSPFLMIGAAIGLVAIKTIVLVIILKWRHVPFKDGLQMGLMLSQGGEFAFVVLGETMRTELLAPELVSQITLVVGLSMALTSPLVALHRHLFKSRSESQPSQDGHWDSYEPEVIIAGFGRFGQIIGRVLAAQSIPFTAMDKNPAHVEFVKQFGNRLFFGDLTRMDILKAAGIKHANVLVVAVNDKQESLAIVDIAKKENSRIKIVARAIDRAHAYELHSLGVDNVIRETFAGSVDAATDVLSELGFTEGQALQVAEMFKQHDESMLLKSVEHKDDLPQLLKLSNQGREELQQLFEEDSKDGVVA